MKKLLSNLEIPAENYGNQDARKTIETLPANRLMAIVVSILLLLSAQHVFAGKPDTSAFASSEVAFTAEKQETNNAVAGRGLFFAPAAMLTGNIADGTNYNQILKSRLIINKQTGPGLFGVITAYTSIRFFIPAENGQKKAYLTLKREKVPFGEKGPGSYSYTAISLKIKF